MSSESVDTTLNALQSALLLCHPRSVIKFGIRYLEDEKAFSSTSTSSTKLEEKHAIQMLPYLIHDLDEFRNHACVIFCGEQVNLSAFEPKDNKSTNSISNGYREYLDGSTIWEIYKAMELSSLGLEHPVVDNYVRQCCESLKKVDFPLFMTVLRIAIACYQIIPWLKDEIYLFLKGVACETERVEYPISGEASMDAHKLKSYFVSKKPPVFTTSSSSAKVLPNGLFPTNFNSIDATHYYHLHQLSTEDIKTWQKLLLTLLEEQRNAQNITVNTIAEKLIQKLLPT